MKLNRWSWGYIPIAVVLGLVWYEFLQSGAFSRPARPVPAATAPAAAAAIQGAPAPASQPATRAVAVVPSPAPPAPPKPGTPAVRVIDEAFLNNPPPISVAVSNASLDQVVIALRLALGPSSCLQISPANVPLGQTFTLTARNTPFWEVFKGLEAQHPIGLASSGMGQPEAGGLVFTSNGAGIYRFQTSGPAIFFPIDITSMKTISGQAAAGTATIARYSLTLGTAVDPRLRVTQISPYEALEMADDTGRNVPVPATPASLQNTPTNYWTSSIGFSVPDPRPHKVSLKGQSRFTVQLSELTATIEDATQKTGTIVTVGDRRLRLVRCETLANQLYVQIAPADPEPQAIPINCTAEDAAGHVVTLPTQPNSTRNIPLTNFSVPVRLVFHAPGQTREVSYPFELKDIPLP